MVLYCKTTTTYCKSKSIIYYFWAAWQAFSCSLLYKSLHPRGLGLESWASSKYELQGSLDVTICGLQRPQHQLLILDPHVPELLHLGLPAALAKQKHIHWITPSTKDQPQSPEAEEPSIFTPASFSALREQHYGCSVQLSLIPHKKNTG